jgi:hypothetical protein
MEDGSHHGTVDRYYGIAGRRMELVGWMTSNGDLDCDGLDWTGDANRSHVLVLVLRVCAFVFLAVGFSAFC